jgi:hypothetical protein
MIGKGWTCEKCGTLVYLDSKMVILEEKLWLKHFNKKDVLCDECIEEKLGRKITLKDLKLDVPVNEWWKQNRSRIIQV